jgi:Icc protein
MSKADDASKNSLQQQLGSLPPGTLRVLQLSDPHLFADPAGCLLGLNTLETLNQVLALARKALPPMDLALVTGDLVHDASPAGYNLLQERLATLGLPTYCIDGNHDEPSISSNHLSNPPVGMPGRVEQGGWQLLLLNSKKPGSEGGHLSEEELQRLEDALSSHPEQHALVCLHHNPVPVGSGWLDTMRVDNAEALFAIIDRHPQVRGVVWGHVHQAFEAQRNGVHLIGTPSTCFQFAPRSQQFGLAQEPPGCRWLALLPTGEIQSGLLYLDEMPTSLDPSSGGY